jgi:Beta-propeller repeat/Abnormal spindle-like microcephaly-assoc'd, ASPM-SPD-2-Hydin
MAHMQENTDPQRDFTLVPSMDRILGHSNTKRVPPSVGRAVPAPFLYGACALVILMAVVDKATLRAQEPSRGERNAVLAEPASSIAGPARQRGIAPVPPNLNRLAAAYGNLPLSFEANSGQAGSDVQFLSRGKGYTLFLGGGDAVFSLRQPGHSPGATENGKRTTNTALTMRLVGANTEAKATGVDSLPGKVNYFIDEDPSKWRTDIPTYARVLYQNVYPGVDVLYHGNQGRLEYDFLVAPGANPSVITLGLTGAPPRLPERSGQAVPLRIDEHGDLVIQTGAGELRFRKPRVYQEQSAVDSRQWDAQLRTSREPRMPNDDDKHFIEGHFVLRGPDRVGFEVTRYDRTRALVIDPTMVYSTYLGGSQLDVGYGIAADSSGNTYIAGQTCSPATPTSGAFPTLNPLPQNSPNPGDNTGADCDAFVTKLNPTGTALVYSTYLGGTGGDYASGIAIDGAGNAYVTGFTNSTDFPTTAGVFQPAYGGGNSDDFVAELNANGSALVYSSYLGGSNSDGPGGIAVDASGNAYVTGATFSADFPTTAGAFRTVYEGNKDAFVTKVNAGGGSLGYSTYLANDDGATSGSAIAVDALGSAFVTGSTRSDDSSFPAVRTNIQGHCGGYNATSTPPCPPYVAGQSFYNAFVTKFSPDGSALVYSTYLGGSTNNDVGTGIALDSFGAAYVTGYASSSDFPVTVGAFQSTLGATGATNAFVAKIDNTGSSLSYSTYLGGSAVDEGQAIAVDTNGVAYVTGGTSSTDFPTVSAIQPTLAGPTVYPGDAFVSKVNAYGSGLIYSSYLGGGDQDVGNGIAVDSSLAVYVTGSTSSTDFPVTSGVFQNTYAGAGDAFVTKMNALTAAVAKFSSRSLSFGPQGLTIPSTPQTVTVTNTGDATLNITQISESGTVYTYTVNATPPYQQTVDLKDWSITTDNCTGIPVAPGGNCTFVVTFAPNLTPNQVLLNLRSGTITVADNAVTSSQSITLSGTAVIPPGITPLPSGLTFNNQLLNSKSAAQAVTVTNSGGFVLAISTITITGPFAETNTCGASLGAGASCTISVTFTPTAAGTSTGTLTITDDSTCLGTQAGTNPLPCSTSPQMVPLTGTSVPVVTLSETNMTFAAQNIGTTSAAQTVTLTNTGEAPLEITGSGASGDFAQSNNCPSTLNPGVSCTITVTFTPTAPGNRYGAVTINDSAANSPQTIVVSGTGSPGPAITLSATNITFPGQSLGTTSSPQPITLGSIGTAPLSITKIGTSGDFAETNNCAPTLAPSASCVINVSFSPTAAGTRTGALTITDNAPGNPQTVTLTGAGLGAPNVGLSPASATFVGQSLGTTSSPLAVTLTNTGSAPLTVTGITVTGDFAQTNNCPSSLAPGAGCAISVTFAPTAAGSRYGSVALADNAAGSPQTIALTGTGLAPAVALSPTSVSFPSQTAGTTSPAQVVTLSNTGGAPLTITGITLTGDFAQTNNCAAGLAAGASCKINVTFTPAASNNSSGSLVVTDNAATSPQTVLLSGVGAPAPLVTLSATALSFPGQSVGAASAPTPVTLTNSGTAPLTIVGITASGDFAQTNTCTPTLAAGSSCIVNVTFTPPAVGTVTGTLTITDSAGGSPHSVALVGSGADFAISITPPTLAVTAGSAARYVVNVTPEFGFTGGVLLSCSGLPLTATCFLSPNPVTPNGQVTSTVAMTVTTKVRSQLPPGPGPHFLPPRLVRPWSLPGFLWLLAVLVTLGMAMACHGRRTPLWPALGLVILSILLWAGCGGSGGGGAGGFGAPSGTPAGNYTLTIAGASGSLTHSATVALTVN